MGPFSRLKGPTNFHFFLYCPWHQIKAKDRKDTLGNPILRCLCRLLVVDGADACQFQVDIFCCQRWIGFHNQGCVGKPDLTLRPGRASPTLSISPHFTHSVLIVDPFEWGRSFCLTQWRSSNIRSATMHLGHPYIP